jgi:hypothetical protein
LLHAGNTRREVPGTLKRSIEPIGAGLAAFIPVGRAYDPDAGEDWRDIVPDIEVRTPDARQGLGLARLSDHRGVHWSGRDLIDRQRAVVLADSVRNA